MKLLLAGLFFSALTGLFAWFLGPSLISDLGLKGRQLVHVSDVRIAEARCRTRLFLLSHCEVSLARPGQAPGATVHYFIASNLGGESIAPLRAAEAGGALTTTLGMDYLTNRIASFAGLMLVMGGFALTGLIQGLRAVGGRR